MENPKIEIYLWGGKKWFFKIKSECSECNVVVSMLKDMEKKEFKNENIKIEVRPWLDNIFSVFFKGGWHAPILIINGKVFSQGIIPNRKKLAEKILR